MNLLLLILEIFFITYSLRQLNFQIRISNIYRLYVFT